MSLGSNRGILVGTCISMCISVSKYIYKLNVTFLDYRLLLALVELKRNYASMAVNPYTIIGLK